MRELVEIASCAGLGAGAAGADGFGAWTTATASRNRAGARRIFKCYRTQIIFTASARTMSAAPIAA